GTMSSVYARYPRNGKTARELAERTGMSVRSAQRLTSEPREVFIKRANEKRVRVQELRAEGLSIRAIAAEIGCSVGIVHRYVKEAEENKTAYVKVFFALLVVVILVALGNDTGIMSVHIS